MMITKINSRTGLPEQVELNLTNFKRMTMRERQEVLERYPTFYEDLVKAEKRDALFRQKKLHNDDRTYTAYRIIE